MTLEELATEFSAQHPDVAHMTEMVMLEQLDGLLEDFSIVEVFSDADVLTLDIQPRYANLLREVLNEWVSE